MREKFAVIILLAAAAVLCCTACGKKKQLDADLSAHKAIPLWEKEALPFSDVSYMPPFFVWHCKTDRAAPVEGTLALTKSAEEKGVEVRQQIYDSGSHGAGMAKNMEILSGWFDECVLWLKECNFCK